MMPAPWRRKATNFTTGWQLERLGRWKWINVEGYVTPPGRQEAVRLFQLKSTKLWGYVCYDEHDDLSQRGNWHWVHEHLDDVFCHEKPEAALVEAALKGAVTR